jgi:GAF domain-containing protein
VLGALTVQHSKSAAFDQDAVTVLQTMADQVAVALDNAAMFAQTQTALEAERRAYGEISREAWAQMLQARPDIGYVCGAQGIRAVEGQWRSELAQAAASGQIVHENGPVLAIPITIRDHVAGAIRLRKPDGALAWTGDEISLMEMLTERLGVALESARLYQDTQRRQARERAISAATSRMREPLELDAVLRTAVSEIRDALDLDELVVRLGSVHQ